MADRRMFHRQVVQADDFLDMSIGAQALYFHMGMLADDDGFVAGPKQAARMVGVGSDELEELVEKGFLLRFDSVVVLTHWRMGNTLKNDRQKPPRYPQIAARLYVQEDKSYGLSGAESLLEEKRRTLESRRNPNRTEPNITEPNITELNTTQQNITQENIKEGSGNITQPAADRMPADLDEEETAPMYGVLGQGVVMLSEKEQESLLDLLGLEGFDKYVRKLSNFILMHNAKIKDHYATILRWWEEDTCL